MKLKMLYSVVLLWLAPFCSVSVAQTSEASVDSYLESLRADLKATHVAIITEAIQFNDQESKAFWPLYRKYDAEVTKVNDQRVALIKSYADTFPTMSDAEARTMIDQSLDFESHRTALKKKYAREFQNVGLSPLTVAKFLQLEHRLDLLVSMKIASELPSLLIKPTGQSPVK